MLQFRFEKLEELKKDTIVKLSTVDKSPNYSKFLINLIVQGLLRIQEEKVVIICREVDVSIISKILTEAGDLYKQIVEKSTGYKPNLEPLKIDTTRRLPPPYVKGSQADFSLGGVELSARGGTVICKNTIEARLEIVLHHLKPTIRSTLFDNTLGSSTEGQNPASKQ